MDGVGALSPTFLFDSWNTPWSHALAMKMVPLSLQRFVFHIDGPSFGIKDERLQASVRKSYGSLVIVREWNEGVVGTPASETRPCLPPLRGQKATRSLH